MLNHDRRGHGEPLVLLHGLGGEWQVWEPVLAALGGRRETFAVDLPGFGGSERLPAGVEPTPAALAGAVADLLDGLGLTDGALPHVAGNSLGGWVALELAARGRARTVTAISAAGLWARPLAPKRGIAQKAARAVLPLLPALLRSPGGRRRALSAMAAHPERIPYHDALALVRAYARSPAFVPTNNAMRARVFDGLRDIAVPVTLARGDRDQLVGPPAHVPPGARLLTLPGCGHIPMWDDPELVARTLLEGSSRP